jgi:hypothetical protein
MTCCAAAADRHDPGTMRCLFCRLVWETTDPHPPPCGVRDAEGGVQARPHGYDKTEFTREL